MKNNALAQVKNFVLKNNSYILFLLLILISMRLSPNFLTVINLTNIGRQYAMLTFVSTGMLFVILTGGIDLSVGSLMALGCVLTGWGLQLRGFSMFTTVSIVVLVGIVFGLCEGFLVTKMNMAPFVVTLAAMTIARGFAYIISNGSPIVAPPNTISRLGTASLFGHIPVLILMAALVVATAWFVLTNTSFGRIVIAIGSNEAAVRLAGIRVFFFKTAVYVISAVAATVGGIITISRTGTGSPVVGSGLELDAIAACVIGGASLSGGEGSPIRTLIGVLILALINNVMNLMSVPSYPQDVIKGVIIILAVLLQTVTSQKKA